MPSSDPRAEGEASGTKKDLFDTFVSRLFKPALNYVQQQATKTGKILKMFLEVRLSEYASLNKSILNHFLGRSEPPTFRVFYLTTRVAAHPSSGALTW